MKTSEALRKAAEVLQERGHYKGDFENCETGSVCALGALNVALAGKPIVYWDSYSDTVVRARRRLVAAFPAVREYPEVPRMESVPLWNDADETTAEDVMLAFKHAAVAAEEEGD